MNINIKTFNVTLTPAITDYLNKRLKKVGRLIGGDTSVQCDVELSKTTGHHNKGDIFRAEIHIVGAAKDIYVAAEKEDLYTAIDEVRDGVLRELKADKAKQISLVRRGGARVKAMIRGMWPWKKSV